MLEMLKTNQSHQGIYIMSPSSAVADAKVLMRGVKRLEKWDLRLHLTAQCLLVNSASRERTLNDWQSPTAHREAETAKAHRG